MIRRSSTRPCVGSPRTSRGTSSARRGANGLLVSLVVAVCAVTVGGCGGGDKAGAVKGAGGASGQEITLRVTNEVPVTAPLNTALTKWKSLVEEKSGGKVHIKLYPAGQLLTDQDAASAVSKGTIDMNISTTGWMAQLVPQLQVFDLPYVFADDQQLTDLWSLPLGKLLNEKLEAHGVQGIGPLMPLTGRIIIATKKPVTKVSDIGGLKIRTFGGAAQQASLKALGAIGVTVPPTEIAPAIETGVISGLATGITYWYQNFKEPLPYATYPAMWHSPYAIWVNHKLWTGLSPATQKIIVDAFRESEPGALQDVKEQEDEALKSGKLKILSDAELQEWKSATAGVPDKFKDTLGTDIVAAVQKQQEAGK